MSHKTLHTSYPPAIEVCRETHVPIDIDSHTCEAHEGRGCFETYISLEWVQKREQAMARKARRGFWLTAVTTGVTTILVVVVLQLFFT